MKLKVIMWVQNKYNPSVNVYLKAAQEVFGSMNNSLMSMFGESIKVGLKEDVSDQYSEMLTMTLGANEPITLETLMETLTQIEEQLHEKFNIPKDNFLYKISIENE